MARRPEAHRLEGGGALAGRAGARDRNLGRGRAARAGPIDGKAAPQVALAGSRGCCGWCPRWTGSGSRGRTGGGGFSTGWTMSFLPGHAEAVLAYEKAMRERNRLLKDQVRDAAGTARWRRRWPRRGRDHREPRARSRGWRAAQAGGPRRPFRRPSLNCGGEDGMPGAATCSALWPKGSATWPRGARWSGRTAPTLLAVYAAKGVPGARLLDRRAEGAADVADPGQCARAGEDFGAPPILLLDEVAAHLDAGPARRAL
jgi:DNA replication and repair protein RecF